ncbi:MAG: ATP synthase F1 subunit delta [Acidimicrobiales bacterium]
MTGQGWAGGGRLRGYVAYVVEAAAAAGVLDGLARDLETFAQVISSSEPLAQALGDGSISVAERAGLVDDLLAQKPEGPVARLAGRGTVASLRRLGRAVVELVPPLQVPVAADWLPARAAVELSRPAGAAGSLPEAPASSVAAKQRLAGYAQALMEDLSSAGGSSSRDIEELEDQLFRFARSLRQSEELRSALTDAAIGPEVRQDIVGDLLPGAAFGSARRLISYAVASGRSRDLVEMTEWLVERAAEERGLRVAEVRSAVPLERQQVDRLAGALGEMTGRRVEVRVTVDPSVLGGIGVVVGGTVVHGTLRWHLDQLRQRLPGTPRGAPGQVPAEAASTGALMGAGGDAGTGTGSGTGAGKSNGKGA